ncbi:MAG: carbohydrate ABC transporter permease [Armatimonadetes bacterium]|nr:carbohydrate ABC transporter permease [Anaerolineae bacterium]
MKTAKWLQALIYAGIAFVTFLNITPLLWVILSSFKTRLEIFTLPPKWIPTSLNFGNFEAVLDKNLPYLLNSVIITSVTTVGVLLIAVPAAFALTVFTIKRKRDIELWIISTRMMPPIAAAVPLFLLADATQLVDTHVGLIILYIGFNLPFAIWLATSFFRSLPKDLFEAAIVDGATWLQVLMRIVVPISAGSIATVTIFTALFSWNELLLALYFTNREAKTFTVVLTEFQGQTNTVWEQMSAAAVIQIIPIIILTFFVQRYIVSGLTMGAVKS